MRSNDAIAEREAEEYERRKGRRSKGGQVDMENEHDDS